MAARSSRIGRDVTRVTAGGKETGRRARTGMLLCCGCGSRAGRAICLPTCQTDWWRHPRRVWRGRARPAANDIIVGRGCWVLRRASCELEGQPMDPIGKRPDSLHRPALLWMSCHQSHPKLNVQEKPAGKAASLLESIHGSISSSVRTPLSLPRPPSPARLSGKQSQNPISVIRLSLEWGTTA